MRFIAMGDIIIQPDKIITSNFALLWYDWPLIPAL